MHCGHGRVDTIKQLVELELIINIINSEICMVEVKHMLKHTCGSKGLFHLAEDFTITLFLLLYYLLQI